MINKSNNLLMRCNPIQIIILAGLLLIILLCVPKKENKRSDLIFYLPLKSKVVLYNIDVYDCLNKSFMDLEKILGAKTEVDTEVSVIFIDKKGDLIKKQIPTETEDYISLTYGPIDDATIMSHYLQMTPKAIECFGVMPIQEDMVSKLSILNQLKEITVLNDSTNDILSKIKSYLLAMEHNEESGIVVNFSQSTMALSKLTIGYFKSDNALCIRYYFSKTTNSYP